MGGGTGDPTSKLSETRSSLVPNYARHPSLAFGIASIVVYSIILRLGGG